MNNTEKMQMLADVLNKTLEKHFPDYEWVLVDYPDMPDIDPDIYLVSKGDANIDSKNIQSETKRHLNFADFGGTKIIPGGIENANICSGIQKALDLSGLHNIGKRVEVGFKGLVVDAIPVNKGKIITIETMGNLIVDSEDIEKIGNNYSQHMEDIFGRYSPTAAMQNLVDTLNKVGKPYHHGNEFIVKGKNNNPCIEISSAAEGAYDMQDALYSSLRYTIHNNYNADAHNKHGGLASITFKENFILDDESIRKIGIGYYKQIRKRLNKDVDKEKTSLSTRIINKLIGKEHC